MRSFCVAGLGQRRQKRRPAGKRVENANWSPCKSLSLSVRAAFPVKKLQQVITGEEIWLVILKMVMFL
jgi:hypothetical protein